MQQSPKKQRSNHTFGYKELEFQVFSDEFLEDFDAIPDRLDQFTQLIDHIIGWDNDIGWSMSAASEETVSEDGKVQEEIKNKKQIEHLQKAFQRIVSLAIYSSTKDLNDKKLSRIKDTADRQSESQIINEWNIYHMLDNVSELTLGTSANSYMAYGGSPMFHPNTSIEKRNRWFIWGGTKTETEDFRKGWYGFRIVRTQGLSPAMV